MTSERMSEARTLLQVAGFRDDGGHLVFRPADHVDPDVLGEVPEADDQIGDVIRVYDADTGHCVTDATERFLCYLVNSRQTEDEQMRVCSDDVRDVVALAYSQIGSLFMASGLQPSYPPAFVENGIAIYMPFSGAYGDFESDPADPSLARLPVEIHGDAYRTWIDEHVADLRSSPRQIESDIQPTTAISPDH